MPLLDIRSSQVDIELGRALGGMTQDLLQDGRGATGLDPERPSGVAEEVGGEVEESG